MLFLRWWLFYSPQAAVGGGGPGGALDALLLEDGTSGLLMEDGSSYFLLEFTPSTAGEPLGLLLTITKAS